MKLILIVIVAFTLAIWMGIQAGHLANRYVKPIQTELVESK